MSERTFLAATLGTVCRKSIFFCLWATMLFSVGCDLEDIDLMGVFGKVSIRLDSSIVVTEGAGVVEIPYQLSGVSKNSGDGGQGKEGQISFTWSTEDITAHKGVDYSVKPRTLESPSKQAGGNIEGQEGQAQDIDGKEIIASGVTTGKISIPLLGGDDNLYEGDKSFKFIVKSLSLNGIEKTGSTLEAIITIKDNDSPPQISISDLTVSEGNQYAEVAYALSALSGAEINFSWSTLRGSAEEVDYQAIHNQNLTIPSGNTSTTGVFRVPLVNDDIDEDAESFQVVIDANSLQGLEIIGSVLQATVTIMDDDEAPTISAAQITRIGEKARRARIMYTLSSVSSKPIGFSWNTVDGSARGGSDFIAVPATPMTIRPGSKSFSLSVEINSDRIDEDDESFQVAIAANSLANATALGSNLQARVIIIDDDREPSIRIASNASNANANEGDAFAKIAYTLNAISSKEISFHWATSDGTAHSGSDYTAIVNQKVTVAPGTRSGILQVPIKNDILDEDNERFSVIIDRNSLVNVQAARKISGNIIIVDNDDAPTISLGGGSKRVVEGEAYTGITYTVSGSFGRQLSFHWGTVDGAARGGEDFTAVSSSPVIINPGDAASGILKVSLNDDIFDENEEDFQVVIVGNTLKNISSTGNTLSKSVIIVDNDAPPTISIESAVKRIGEGDGHVEITYALSAISYKEMGFHWSTSNGAALGGDDFIGVNNKVATINPGTNRGTLRVALIDDTVDEADESFQVAIHSQLLNNIGAGSNLQQAVLIVDNDQAPTISLEQAKTVSEGGDDHALVAYTLSGPSSKQLSFSWKTVDDTALGGQDFAAVASKSVTINPGTTSGTLQVSLTNDVLDEERERFGVVINASSLDDLRAGSNLQAVVTIDDNDLAPTISLGSEVVRVSEGEPHVDLTYTLSSASGRQISFDWRALSTSAQEGEDFVSVSNQKVIIGPGSTRGTLRVVLIDDIFDEKDENFRVRIKPSSLINVSNSISNNLRQEVLILDNDDRPTISIESAIKRVSEGAGHVEITYTLSAISYRTTRFRWDTSDVSARGDEDFIGVISKLVTINPKTKSGTLQVALIDDAIDEVDKIFRVVIDPQSLRNIGAGNLQRNVLIVDDDQGPTISLVGSSIREGSAQVELAYTLNFASKKQIRFNWSTINGTALSGEDYRKVSGQSEVIAPGTTSGTLQVVLIEDYQDEGDEAFRVGIASNSLYGIESTGSILQATVNIIENTNRASDSFTQKKLNNKVDILWVIDNSRSMGDDQRRLSSNFSSFIDNFISADGQSGEQNLNFKMGIITTDRAQNVAKDVSFKLKVASNGFVSTSDDDSDNVNIGQAASFVTLRHSLPAGSSPVVRRTPSISGTNWWNYDRANNVINFTPALARGMRVGVSYRTLDEPISLTSAENDRVAVINQFEKKIKVGVGGSMNEMGLKYSSDFLSNNSAWIRSGAYLVIIYVSDEEDGSRGTTASFFTSLSAHKGDSDLFKVFSIVNNNNTCRVDSPCRGGSSYGGRYIALANSSGGAVASIANSFDQVLNSFGENIRRLTDSFFLSQKPTHRSSIKIFINGVRETGNTWIYDEGSNSVRFISGSVPSTGSIVQVVYTIPG